VSRGRDLLAALVSAQAGGLLAVPPEMDGTPGLGIAGVSGVSRARTWDAVASVRAPELSGEGVTFVALDDGTLVVDEDVPDDSLAPLADAIEATVGPAYRAAALRASEDVWMVVAERVEIVELSLEGEEIDLSVVAGERELTIDGERTNRPVPALDALAEQHGDLALHAERVDGDLFAVDVFPL
jgi:hypothetical protein